jgi:hypothetical protein
VLVAGREEAPPRAAGIQVGDVSPPSTESRRLRASRRESKKERKGQRRFLRDRGLSASVAVEERDRR